MTLRKIADPVYPCRSLDHDPPGMIVLPPGTYEHTCSACGRRVVFTVPLVTCVATADHPFASRTDDTFQAVWP